MGDLGLVPGLGRSPGEGKGYPLQYSGLENSTDCIAHGISKSRTWMSDFHFHCDIKNIYRCVFMSLYVHTYTSFEPCWFLRRGIWGEVCQDRISLLFNNEFLYCQIFPFLIAACGSAYKESTCNVGDLGLIPGLGRSPGEGKGYPLHDSGLENSMDCIVHRVTKSQTRLSDFHLLTSII